jgi:hypothetical protein
MALGASTNVINGQFIGLPQGYQYAPQGYGPGTVTVPSSPPTVPPSIGGGSSTQLASASGLGQVGLYGSQAAAHPWSLKVSPLPWAVLGLLFALVMLHLVHYRTVK